LCGGSEDSSKNEQSKSESADTADLQGVGDSIELSSRRICFLRKTVSRTELQKQTYGMTAYQSALPFGHMKRVQPDLLASSSFDFRMTP
jgi:hypothetical protein